MVNFPSSWFCQWFSFEFFCLMKNIHKSKVTWTNSWSQFFITHFLKIIPVPGVTWTTSLTLKIFTLHSTCHLLSHWFLAWLILRPWRWRLYVPLKHRLTFNRLHGVISQKIVLSIATAVRTLDPASPNLAATSAILVGDLNPAIRGVRWLMKWGSQTLLW
jgi:hypothetical protein